VWRRSLPGLGLIFGGIVILNWDFGWGVGLCGIEGDVIEGEFVIFGMEEVESRAVGLNFGVMGLIEKVVGLAESNSI
jgi:hypothetical protein